MLKITLYNVDCLRALFNNWLVLNGQYFDRSSDALHIDVNSFMVTLHPLNGVSLSVEGELVCISALPLNTRKEIIGAVVEELNLLDELCEEDRIIRLINKHF